MSHHHEKSYPSDEQSTLRTACDRVLGVLMEGLVLVTVVVTPWMCPGQCVYPNVFGGSLRSLRGVDNRLVFSVIVVALLGLWALRLLVRRRVDWKWCPVTL